MLFHPASAGGVGFRNPSTVALQNYAIPIARTIRHATTGIQFLDENQTTATLPLPFQSIIGTWESNANRFFTLYRSIAVSITRSFIPACQTPLHTFTFDINHRTLRRDLYRHATKNNLDAAFQTADPITQANKTSLTSTLTSIPLHSLSRTHPENRLSNHDYQLALQCKLRVPCLPPHLVGTLCTCGKPLDEHLDHAFNCPHTHKAGPHNTIRNTYAHIFRTIAPIAQFCESKFAVSIETKQLFQADLHRRPADICIALAPSYLATPTPKAFSLAIFDVTIPPAPSPSSGTAPLTTAATALSQHLKAETKKFHGPDRCPARETLLAELNANSMVLFPLSVDHLGGLGPSAQTFLYGTPPPPTHAIPPDKFNNAHAWTAYCNTRTNHTPKGLLPAADLQWRKHHPMRRFGQSYHTQLPSQWATQLLGLNITIAYARVLRQTIQRCQFATDRPPPPVLGPTFPYATRNTFLSRPTEILGSPLSNSE